MYIHTYICACVCKNVSILVFSCNIIIAWRILTFMERWPIGRVHLRTYLSDVGLYLCRFSHWYDINGNHRQTFAHKYWCLVVCMDFSLCCLGSKGQILVLWRWLGNKCILKLIKNVEICILSFLYILNIITWCWLILLTRDDGNSLRNSSI